MVANILVQRFEQGGPVMWPILITALFAVAVIGERIFWWWRESVKRDPKTLEKKWEFKMNDITWAGVLTTASDLVFSGGKEGYFFALDARSGDLLWKVALGGQVNSGPMSYSVNGKQYVTVAAGSALFGFALRQ